MKTKLKEILSLPIEELKHTAFNVYDNKTDTLIYKNQDDYEIYVEYNTETKHYHTDFATLETSTDGNYEYEIDEFGNICIIASIECFEITIDKLIDLITYIQRISQEFHKKEIKDKKWQINAI